jgi:hypothetical protein
VAVGPCVSVEEDVWDLRLVTFFLPLTVETFAVDEYVGQKHDCFATNFFAFSCFPRASCAFRRRITQVRPTRKFAQPCHMTLVIDESLGSYCGRHK